MRRLFDWIPAFAGMTTTRIQENFEELGARTTVD